MRAVTSLHIVIFLMVVPERAPLENGGAFFLPPLTGHDEIGFPSTALGTSQQPRPLLHHRISRTWAARAWPKVIGDTRLYRGLKPYRVNAPAALAKTPAEAGEVWEQSGDLQKSPIPNGRLPPEFPSCGGLGRCRSGGIAVHHCPAMTPQDQSALPG